MRVRAGPLLVLLVLLVLVAAAGVEALGWIVLFALVLVLLAVGAVALAIWSIKRRMRRNLERLADLLAGQRGGGAPPPPDPRGGAIDVQGTVRKPRDGADDPDDLPPR